MRKIRYGQAGYVGCRMSVRAVEAYERGLLPASKAAREFGFKNTREFVQFFRPDEWHHVGKYATPCNFYDVPGQVEAWEHPADVPRGLLRAVSKRMRPWFEQQIREMLRENWLSWQPDPKWLKARAEERISDNLSRESGYTALRCRGISFRLSGFPLGITREAFAAVARLVRNHRVTFREAVEMVRGFVEHIRENPDCEREEAKLLLDRALEMKRAKNQMAAAMPGAVTEPALAAS